VRSTLGFRPPKPARRLHHDTKAGFQEFQICARRNVEGRRVGRFNDEVVAAVRWGAAGQDTRAHPWFGKEKPRLDGQYSRAQGSARLHLAARRRVEGFPLGPAN
jgi:hypothetical protein